MHRFEGRCFGQSLGFLLILSVVSFSSRYMLVVVCFLVLIAFIFANIVVAFL